MAPTGPSGAASEGGGARRIGAVFAALALLHGPVAAQTLYSLEVDAAQVRRWNAFADGCLALHERQLEGREVRAEERVGGYAGAPRFYREITYFDRATGALLSRIQWERGHAGRLHALEVYVHDDEGRVVRDYAVAYLPQARNAPVQTLINLHAYHGELHAFRQFDASGATIHESCEGRHRGEAVHIRLFEDDLTSPSPAAREVMASEIYGACFGGLPRQPGVHLDPQ